MILGRCGIGLRKASCVVAISRMRRATSLMLLRITVAITDKAVPPLQIVLSGQSLGTGVACQLAARSLAGEGKCDILSDVSES